MQHDIGWDLVSLCLYIVPKRRGKRKKNLFGALIYVHGTKPITKLIIELRQKIKPNDVNVIDNCLSS